MFSNGVFICCELVKVGSGVDLEDVFYVFSFNQGDEICRSGILFCCFIGFF